MQSPASKEKFPLRVRAVMIDLDGTLLDTIPDLAAAANATLTELGRPELSEELLRTFVGKGIPRLVEKFGVASYGPSGAPPDLLARFERHYDAVNGRHTVLYPGVKEGLDALREAGFPLACVTNKAARFTLPLLEAQGIAGYFEQVIAGDTLPQKKPDPLPLLHACKQFGVAPADMLMIGDSLNDAQAARSAGCPVFCVPYGYNEGHDVRELDIDAIVASVFEATRLIIKAK